MLATLILGWAVGTGSTGIDAWFATTVRSVVGADPRWLLAFTDFRLVAAVLLVCLVVTVTRRQWRLSVAVVTSPLVGIAVNSALKQLFHRRNGPYLEYPSGHTTLLIVALGMLVVVTGGRRWALTAATMVSLLGALGVVACGYHYLTDTIGSALLASALVCVAARLAEPAPGPSPAHRRTAIALAAVGLAGLGSSAAGSASPGDPATADFVDVRGVVPTAVIDLRYATADNFLGSPLYPPGARCLVHHSLAAGLVVAAEALQRQQLRLVFWDCYRPHRVQVAMFDAVPDPTWVARPGPFARSHVAGRSVDVTLADLTGRTIDMGTDFDDFSPRAGAFATDGLSRSAISNRAVLRNAMQAGGFSTYPSEWWHFDGPGAGVERPIVDVPLG